MRYLIAFLRKNSFFFLFIFLECIAFMLMINSQNYQGSVIINSTNQFTGSVNNISSDIVDYFQLRKSNHRLLEENTFLLNSQQSSFIVSDTVFQYRDSIYRFIGAKVISNSTHKRNNYIMLNRGRKHGIEIDMGVISDKGLVGIVIGVSEGFCSVMSALHKDSKISARIKKNNQLASVTWNEIDYKHGILEDIPTHLKLNSNDTIISSGNSLIFPEGILIGTVTEYHAEDGKSLNSASIRFACDFNALYYVYIIKNLKRHELLNLQKEVRDE